MTTSPMPRTETGAEREAERKARYHARKWAMSEKAKPQPTATAEMELPLDCIDTSPAAAVRAELNADAVQQYSEAESLPPIDVCEGGGKYFLGDGRHRLESKRATNTKKVTARVRRFATAEEARAAAQLTAFGANSEHGLPRTKEDKRAAIRACLAVPEYAEQSDRRIAEMCKVGHWLVGQVREELTNANKLTGKAAKGSPERKASGNPAGQKPAAKPETVRATSPAPEPKSAAKPDPLPVLPPEPEEEPAPIQAGKRAKDARGRVIPEPLAELFARGKSFVNDVRATLAEVVEGVKAEANEPHGAGLGACVPTLEQDVKKIGTDIAAAVPWCVCPHVGDDGQHTYEGKCKVCIGNRGWLSRHNWHQLSDSVKQLIDDVANESEAA